VTGLSDLLEGLRYAMHHREIRAVILVVSVVTLFGFSVFTLFPAWAVEILKGGAQTNGLLQSARGVGSVVSAFLIAALGPRLRFRGLPLIACVVALPASIALFALGRSMLVALAALVAVGGLMIAVYNIANSLVQTLVEDRMRGRVMGIYSLTFFGFLPLGGLQIGELAGSLGSAAAVWLNLGALAIAASVIWFRAPWMRRLP
jgi:MFS family permease